MMRRVAIALLLLSMTLSAAPAQEPAKPPESVTVTGLKDVPPQVIDRFIDSYAAPTYLLDKMSRWEDGICPIVAGLRPSAVSFILERVKENAARVGAPVNGRANCRTNIEIIFTTTPQGLLDTVRRKYDGLLGYHSSSAQADKLAVVKRDIQAWYTTATKDIAGRVKVDNARSIGLGDANELAAALEFGGNSKLSHLGDGRRSVLYNGIVAINPDKLADREIGGLADYISVVALSQLTSLDRCQSLPSIVNMLVPNCAAGADAMTPSDLAFLRGLYRMRADSTLRMQKDFIAYEMRRELSGN